jgi:hypothetical protein
VIRQKILAGRLIETVALVWPLLLLAALCHVADRSAIAWGLLGGAAVPLVASVVAPRSATLIHAYFARFTAPVLRWATDALIVVVYAVLMPIGVALRLRRRLAHRQSNTCWRKA